MNKPRIADGSIKLEGSYKSDSVYFVAARVVEALSTLTETRLEFASADGMLDPADILGTRMTIKMDEKANLRKFHGVCIAIEYLGTTRGYTQYAADLRPWTWFLTRSSDNRIFQNQTAPDIIAAVFSGLGFSGFRTEFSKTYAARDYCVQYGETNFDFISRLMEEEGIYYYFKHGGETEELVLADAIGSHSPISHTPTLDFIPRSKNTPAAAGHVFEWSPKMQVVSGKVSLVDYDMVKPRADLRVASSIARGKHAHKDYEIYETDAHYATSAEGDDAARVRMERLAHGAERYLAAGTAPAVSVGSLVTIKNVPEPGKNVPEAGKQSEFLILAATHHLRIEPDLLPQGELDGLKTVPRLTYPESSGLYVSQFETAAKTQQFRPPKVTPWPDLAGLHTAVVTGPEGDEIHTDKYGRIKVMFRWDRKGKEDEKTSCWVRTVLPWTGKGWGMYGVPRIGQEVVIQFERGNPDRPICTGMLYNEINQTPVALPANMTQSGVKTNSTKGGAGFNELMFEDKQDAEFVRLQSEKDFVQIIKNNATITIGLEKKDKGDLTQTIHGSKTETVKTGDHSFKIENGSQTIDIEKDHTETINGKSSTTVKGNVTIEVQDGNLSETIKSGNYKREVSSGNDATKLGSGNYTIDASGGKITLTAAQEITLEVGGNSIKIGPAGIDIKGTIVKIEGSAMAEVKSLLTTVKGEGMLTLKGGITMIN